MAIKTKRIMAALIVTVGILWLFWLNNQLAMPNVEILRIENPQTTAFMRRYHGGKPLKHIWAPYPKISPHLKEAVVIAEDGRFFEHEGVDWEAFREAVKKNWEKKKFRVGGSTITQQVAKNLYLSPSKNPIRKLREMLIAMKMEQVLSKQRILEIYLNIAEWGDGIYGAEAAGRHFFNTSAANLGARESAWLAAALPSPRYFEKHRGSGYLLRRVDRILRVMGYGKSAPKKMMREIPQEPEPEMEEPPPPEEF